MIFGCQSLIINTGVDIHNDIQIGTSIEGHSTINIRETWKYAN